jgi:hypothetical protein
MFQSDLAEAAKVPKVFIDAMGKPHNLRRALDWHVQVWAIPRLWRFSKITNRDEKSEYLSQICQDLVNRFPNLSAKALQRNIYSLNKVL